MKKMIKIIMLLSIALFIQKPVLANEFNHSFVTSENAKYHDQTVNMILNILNKKDSEFSTYSIGEYPVIRSSVQVVPYGIISSRFGGYVAANSTQTKSLDWSLSVGTSIKGFPLSAAISYSSSTSVSGPGTSDYIGSSSIIATHTSYFSIGYGKIHKVIADIYDGTTNSYLRTDTYYFAYDASAVMFTQKTSLQSNGSIYVQHVSNNNYKSFSTKVLYENTIKGTTPADAFSW